MARSLPIIANVFRLLAADISCLWLLCDVSSACVNHSLSPSVTLHLSRREAEATLRTCGRRGQMHEFGANVRAVNAFEMLLQTPDTLQRQVSSAGAAAAA